MADIQSPATPSAGLPFIPDNVTLPQFILDAPHPTRPIRKRSPWLIDDGTGRKVGFEELRTRTFNLANALSIEYNIKEGDIVVIFSPNHIDYPVAIWAIHRLGAIVSGANPTYTTEELIYQIEATKACMIITDPESLDLARSAAKEAGVAADRIILFEPCSDASVSNVRDLVTKGSRSQPMFVERRLRAGEGKTKIAFLSFSSGTTGKPKAVAIPHIAPIANVIQLAVHNRVNEDYCSVDDRRFRPGDVAIAVLPLYHIYGLIINLHFMLFCGMSVVVVPKFNFTRFLQSIVRHRITHLFLVPPHAVLLCKSPEVKQYNLSHVRFVMVGAAPLSAELHHQLLALFPNAHLGQAYGMTETSTAVSMWTSQHKRGLIGSAGQLLAGVTVRVIKSDGSLAFRGEPGELVVKSPSNAIGYYNNVEATNTTFRDGWVHSGDEVIIDNDSEMFVIDRLKEIMKVRGFQVAPADLEGCLFDHTDVADACVVGIPDEYSGEVPLAFVVLKEDARRIIEQDPRQAANIKASIVKFVSDRRVKYKHLAGGVEFIDVIPRNPSGKLLRRFLRDQAKGLRAKPRSKL